jgi:hypothetical protein
MELVSLDSRRFLSIGASEMVTELPPDLSGSFTIVRGARGLWNVRRKS